MFDEVCFLKFDICASGSLNSGVVPSESGIQRIRSKFSQQVLHNSFLHLALSYLNPCKVAVKSLVFTAKERIGFFDL